LVIDLANNNDLIAVDIDLLKIIYVEKVRAAEMLVTRWFAGPNLARIDDDDDFGRKSRQGFSDRSPRT
jgi:hypothetical protein